MKLRRFNENKESIEDKFKSWLEDNANFTENDLLYYFSTFTDEYGYDYSIIKSLSHGSNEICKSYYFNNFKVEFSRNVEKSTQYVDGYIQLGEELKKFKSCLNQFKNLEEIELLMNERYCVYKNDNEEAYIIEISFNFNKYISTEVLNQLKNESDEEKKNIEKIKNDKISKISRADIQLIMDSIDKENLIFVVRNMLDDGENLEIDIDFDYSIDQDSNGDIIVTLIPLVIMDGELDSDLSSDLNDYHYNYDKKKFIGTSTGY